MAWKTAPDAAEVSRATIRVRAAVDWVAARTGSRPPAESAISDAALYLATDAVRRPHSDGIHVAPAQVRVVDGYIVALFISGDFHRGEISYGICSCDDPNTCKHLLVALAGELPRRPA